MRAATKTLAARSRAQHSRAASWSAVVSGRTGRRWRSTLTACPSGPAVSPRARRGVVRHSGAVPPPATAEAPRERVGHADAWFASPPASAAPGGSGSSTLDAEERRRLSAITDPTTARAYAVLHLLARDVLGRVVGAPPARSTLDRTCTRCRGQHGAPRVVGHPDLHVSLSRTPDLVAVAVSMDAPSASTSSGSPAPASRASTPSRPTRPSCRPTSTTTSGRSAGCARRPRSRRWASASSSTPAP